MGLAGIIKSWFGGKDCKYTANILGKKVCTHPGVSAAIGRQKYSKAQEYYSGFCRYIGKIPLEIKQFVVSGNPSEYAVCKYNPKAKK